MENIQINNLIKKENLLDEGKTNLGYTVEEAIMEAIDDSLDANAKDIQIKLFEELYKDKDLVARRCSYVICDKGIGIHDIENVFKFGNKKEIKYKNKEDYYTKNSRFNYGNISHINVGSEVTYYSKTENDSNWKCISLSYDKYEKCGHVSKTRQMTEDEKNRIEATGINIPKLSGTILYVKGICKTEFNSNNLDILIDKIIKNIESTYYYLSKDVNLTFNNHKTFYVSPIGEDLIDDFIKPTVFGEYEITLEEIFNRLGDNITKSEIINEFVGIFSINEMLNETIKVKLVAININFTLYKSKIQKDYPKLNELYYPSIENQGFYIKRNKRYIGKALGMLGILTDHPSYNRFRGEITINPIFDDFFKIQMNKNRNTVSNVVITLIKEKIAKDDNLEGDSLSAKIEWATGERKEKDDEPKPNPVELFKKRIKVLQNKVKRIKTNYERYYQDTKKISELEILLKDNFLSENEIEQLEQKAAQMETEYQKNYRNFYEDVKLMIDRINSKRKILKDFDEKGEAQNKRFLSMIKQPLQEGELYGIFYLIYTLYPEKFDFKLLDYYTNEGLDCLIQIDCELFMNLNLDKRFGILMQKILDEIEVLEDNYEKSNTKDGYKFCYLELKVKLAENMNHSLALTSHIICWNKNNIEQIQATDDLYGFTDATKTLLVNSNLETFKKIKVIYLKDIIEEITCSKFKR